VILPLCEFLDGYYKDTIHVAENIEIICRTQDPVPVFVDAVNISIEEDALRQYNSSEERKLGAATEVVEAYIV
jgi:hypothetical protein